MQIQVSGQQRQIGECLQGAAECRSVVMAAVRPGEVRLHAHDDRRLRLESGVRKRLGRYERYSMRRGSHAAVVGQETGLQAAMTFRNAAYGDCSLAEQRPDTNTGWIGAGPGRVARG